MNYFELFDIPVSFKPDKALIPKKYFELQRETHPDFFTKSDEEDQEKALEKSSMVNKALKVLQNDDLTIEYTLTLLGILKKDEKYDLAPDFLMEMMELNESLMEAEGSSIPEMEVKVSMLQNELYEPVKHIINGYNPDNTTEAELLQVKDYYYKKKYLHRLLERLDGMRNIASP